MRQRDAISLLVDLLIGAAPAWIILAAHLSRGDH